MTKRTAPASSGADDALLQALRTALGGDAISIDEDERARHMTDALGTRRGVDAAGTAPTMPLAVALPATTEQVAVIVRLANEHRTPLVPYGGGTGLMGGARSIRPGIVVDLRRLDRVREVDADAGWVWAEAGCVLADVQRALEPHGLIIGHDPWTFAIATVGGTISTNGLGFLGGKYGSMGEQVLALEAVMADGAVVRTRPARPRSTGLDLDRLLIGGEGAFGIITAAALRTFPKPESRVFAGFRFGTFEGGYRAILAMRRIGLQPAVLDFGERTPLPADSSGAPGWVPEAEPPTLYLAFDGLREETAALLARAVELCERAGGARLDDQQVREFWESRHVPAENFARSRAARVAPQAAPDETTSFDYLHVALPATAVLRYREQALGIMREHGVHVVETGVWVSPALLSMVMVSRAVTGEEARRRMSAAIDACLRLAHGHGGSMEYCHGAGMRLAHLMAEEHGAGLRVMRTVKRALDPRGIMNPGKLGLDGE